MDKQSDNDFLELLELQGNLAMVTKSELIEQARKRGAAVSDRQLTSLISEGLLPKSARIGSRAGAYPQIAVRLLVFVTRSRKRGLSVQAIRELLPLWKYIQRAIRDGELSLIEFEYIARESITVSEAWFAVPAVLQECLPCPTCISERYPDMKFITKDGEVHQMAEPLSIGFAMAAEDPDTHEWEFKGKMRIALPASDEGLNPSSIVLGAPNGVKLPTVQVQESHVDLNGSRGPARGRDQAEKGA